MQEKTAIPGVLPTFLQPIQTRLIMLQTGFHLVMAKAADQRHPPRFARRVERVEHAGPRGTRDETHGRGREHQRRQREVRERIAEGIPVACDGRVDRVQAGDGLGRNGDHVQPPGGTRDSEPELRIEKPPLWALTSACRREMRTMQSTPPAASNSVPYRMIEDKIPITDINRVVVN